MKRYHWKKGVIALSIIIFLMGLGNYETLIGLDELRLRQPKRPHIIKEVCQREARLLRNKGWHEYEDMPPLKLQVCTALEFRLLRDSLGFPVYLMGEGVGSGMDPEDALGNATTTAVNDLLTAFYGELLRLFLKAPSSYSRENFYEVVDLLWDSTFRYNLVLSCEYIPVTIIVRNKRETHEAIVRLAVEREEIFVLFNEFVKRQKGYSISMVTSGSK